MNVLPGLVEAVVPIEGAALEVQLRLGDDQLLARVTRRSGEALGLAPGRQVYAVIKTVAIGRSNFGSRGDIVDPGGHLDEAVEIFDC